MVRLHLLSLLVVLLDVFGEVDFQLVLVYIRVLLEHLPSDLLFGFFHFVLVSFCSAVE